jgi:RNase P subunit RPR2
MASQKDRNARLDKLLEATNSWADSEEKRLKRDVVLMKRIMRGRTGSERLNNVSVQTATVLVVDEISQFLTGD